MTNDNQKLIINNAVINADYVSLRLHKTGIAVLEILATEDEISRCLSVDHDSMLFSLKYGDFCGKFIFDVIIWKVVDDKLSVKIQFKYSEPEKATVPCMICGKENEGHYINDDEVFVYCGCMKGLCGNDDVD